MFCKQCGVELPEGAAFCTSCGTNQSDSVIQAKPENPVPGKVCPKCGSTEVEIQMHQETTSSTTVTKSKSKYKEKVTAVFGGFALVGGGGSSIFAYGFVLLFRDFLLKFSRRKNIRANLQVWLTPKIM